MSKGPSPNTFPSNGQVWQRVKWNKRAQEKLEELKRNIIRYERRKRIEQLKKDLGLKYLEKLGFSK
ncbi:MAG: hypothetical protein L0Y56_12170 [Nitrospira sp.]|nr:hypothetical protein [Nitrospira sp.]